MLFIYGSLKLGGVETFYIRMAKARFRMGKKTKFLLTSNKKENEKELIDEAKKYADIYFLDDFLKFNIFTIATIHTLLIKPIRIDDLSIVFNGIEQVHVSNSIYGLLYMKINKRLKVNIPLTVGVYHAKEFTWKNKGKLPYYELCNRALFSDLLKSNLVYFFNDKLPNIYSNYYDFGKFMTCSNVFPLGVLDTHTCQGNHIKFISHPVRIVSVGRLVSFKSYNLWMIEVINMLNSDANIEYHIYGTGPLEDEMRAKIQQYGLADKVFLKGSLSYLDFKNVISQYDIFVGSGTSIIEASGLGVPSIIGIESIKEPISYGFLCDIDGFSYNEDGLYEKFHVKDLILNFLKSSHFERKVCSEKHISWAQKFTMEACALNFERASSNVTSLTLPCSTYSNFWFRFKYSISLFSFSLICKLKKTSLSKLVYD